MPFLLDAVRIFAPSHFRRARLAGGLVLTGLVLLLISGAVWVSAVQAEPPAAGSNRPHAQAATEGQKIFEQRCTGCHTIGGGRLVGPDLKDVTTLRDTQWLKAFITDPAKMIATDPAAQQLYKDYNNITMPTMGLTPDQIDQVIAYLSNPGAAGGAGAAPAPTPLPAGAANPQVGRQLFLGEAHLANGGTPCIACHTVSGAGALGGGALGPDLTHVVARLGEPGLSASITTIAFPTMVGPFQNRPLTAQEVADLVAFLKEADQTQPPVPAFAAGALTTHTLLVFSIALGGAVVLFGVLFFFWMRISRRRFPLLSSRDL